MKIMFNNSEKKIIKLISYGIDIVSKPYEVIAQKLNLKEDDIINFLNKLVDLGAIKRVSAILKQTKLGYNVNAMCVFNISTEKIDEVGNYASKFCEVTHCYKRPSASDWPYNLYVMLHCKNQNHCLEIVNKIVNFASCSDYQILYTVKELKKSNMIYFNDETI